MQHQLVWVDIPVVDLGRAIVFYAAVLGENIVRHEMNGMAFGVLPHADTAVAGCLYVSQDNAPSQHGPLIYLSVNGRMEQALLAVSERGGQVLQAKQPIGEHGYRAIVLDSEGNRIALHAQRA